MSDNIDDATFYITNENNINNLIYNTIFYNTIFYNNTDPSFNFEFLTNVSLIKYKQVPEYFKDKISKKTVEYFPIVYKKNKAINTLLQIFKIERKHPESKLYYQIIGSFVETHNKDISYGDDFLNVIKEYYNINLHNIPKNSYTISFYNTNSNPNYFFYVYRFTYYNTNNVFIRIDINEYYLI